MSNAPHKSPRLNRIHTIEPGDMLFLRMKMPIPAPSWSNSPMLAEFEYVQRIYFVTRRECCRVHYRGVGEPGSKELNSEGWLDLGSNVIDSWEIVK